MKLFFKINYYFYNNLKNWFNYIKSLKASAVVSRTQLYKQAGNSIVVDVLEHIFKEMI